jgi:hypothetical protein
VGRKGVGVVEGGVVEEVVLPPVLGGVVGVPKYQAVPVVEVLEPVGVVVLMSGPPPSEKAPPVAVRV